MTLPTLNTPSPPPRKQTLFQQLIEAAADAWGPGDVALLGGGNAFADEYLRGQTQVIVTAAAGHPALNDPEVAVEVVAAHIRAAVQAAAGRVPTRECVLPLGADDEDCAIHDHVYRGSVLRPFPKAHWSITRGDEDPRYPWLVAHRVADSADGMQHEHGHNLHEYGAFATYAEALEAMKRWSLRSCTIWSTDEHLFADEHRVAPNEAGTHCITPMRGDQPAEGGSVCGLPIGPNPVSNAHPPLVHGYWADYPTIPTSTEGASA